MKNYKCLHIFQQHFLLGLANAVEKNKCLNLDHSEMCGLQVPAFSNQDGG